MGRVVRFGVMNNREPHLSHLGNGEGNEPNDGRPASGHAFRRAGQGRKLNGNLPHAIAERQGGKPLPTGLLIGAHPSVGDPSVQLHFICN